MKRRRGKVLRKRYGRGVAAYNRGSRLISRQLDRAVIRDGWYCNGRMENGPNKNYARCQKCGHIDYEKNEGDLCGRLIVR